MKKIVTVALISLSAASGCGLEAQPVNHAASHIADTAAAGKAAHAKCESEKTNCEQVTQAFDEISKDAEELKTLSGEKK